MVLASVHLNKAPQFLDLLNAIVKVEELNLPLKRNQGYVMKYFMQYRCVRVRVRRRQKLS